VGAPNRAQHRQVGSRLPAVRVKDDQPAFPDTRSCPDKRSPWILAGGWVDRRCTPIRAAAAATTRASRETTQRGHGKARRTA